MIHFSWTASYQEAYISRLPSLLSVSHFTDFPRPDSQRLSSTSLRTFVGLDVMLVTALYVFVLKRNVPPIHSRSRLMLQRKRKLFGHLPTVKSFVCGKLVFLIFDFSSNIGKIIFPSSQSQEACWLRHFDAFLFVPNCSLKNLSKRENKVFDLCEEVDRFTVDCLHHVGKHLSACVLAVVEVAVIVVLQASVILNVW